MANPHFRPFSKAPKISGLPAPDLAAAALAAGEEDTVGVARARVGVVERIGLVVGGSEEGDAAGGGDVAFEEQK